MAKESLVGLSASLSHYVRLALIILGAAIVGSGERNAEMEMNRERHALSLALH